MIKKKYLIIACFLTSFLRADFLPLPSSLNSRAVFYKRVKQLDDFSCGYNVMYNACVLERACGYANKYNNEQVFTRICSDYVRRAKKNALAGTSEIELEELAKKMGMMQPISVLRSGQYDASRIEPFIKGPVEITHLGGISQEKINRMLQRAWEKRADDYLKNLERVLNERPGRQQILHFVCHITTREGAHWILMSIVKNGSGRGLYIFDNINSRIDERSQTKRYIDFLCATYSISPQRQFRGPKI